MTDHGARRLDLLNELRRVGPTVEQAIEDLGICVVYVAELPGGSMFWADPRGMRIMGAFDSEVSLWAGVACCLAYCRGIDATASDILKAAAKMARARSGTFPAYQSA